MDFLTLFVRVFADSFYSAIRFSDVLPLIVVASQAVNRQQKLSNKTNVKLIKVKKPLTGTCDLATAE